MMAAVIPARQEAARIAGAVAALRSEGVTRILVVANGCTDATAERAAAAGAAVIEVGCLENGVGEARALGCAEAMARWSGTSMLISTDADGRLCAGAVAALKRALERADAAMGRVVPDPAEHSRLPRHVIAHGELEARRDSLLAELCALCMPSPHDPVPRHLFRAGALMAFRPEAYRGVGGFRPMPCHEDKHIAARLSLAGYRLAHPWGAAVSVSCRTSGRAPEGMANTIAKRLGLDLYEQTQLLETQCRRLARLVRAMRDRGPDALFDLASLVRDATAPSVPALARSGVPGPALPLPANDREGTSGGGPVAVAIASRPA